MSLHSFSLGAPILIEEAKAMGIKVTEPSGGAASPACAALRAAGQWNQSYDPCFELDPVWTEEFMTAVVKTYANGPMTPKLVQLINIAFNVSYTNMSAPGTHRHINEALKIGVTIEEITETLKLCVSQGIQACNLGVPILLEEITNHSAPEEPN